MTRIDIINSLIQKHNYKSYLEIGVRNPNDCFNHINCELKHGVDPGVEGNYDVTFKLTSDDFFKSNKRIYDIIFIDGLHIDEQVYRDIVNSLDFLSVNGTIVLHDCNPPTIYHAREDYGDNSTPARGYWNGTTWKAIVKARTEIKNIKTCVVDTDWGVGIIQKSDVTENFINDNEFYSYNKFSKNRVYYLNLISPATFKNEYINDIRKNNVELTWLAKYDDFSSMGILSQRILENLKDYEISCKAIIGKTETQNEFIHELLKKETRNNLGIMFSYPNMFHELNNFETKVIYTGVDSTGGIKNFAQNCNMVDFLLTPSTISKNRMEALGVKKPIFVFPHGIDENLFKFTPRSKSDKFKFLYVGECSDRKGIFQLLDAFIALFSNNPKVELHIKSNEAMVFYNGQRVLEYTKKYPNIVWHISNKGHDEVIKLYEECHAYVYPSRADTFGMTLLEAMACGLPVISTSDPGATELIKGRYIEIPSKNVPVENHPWMLGEWGQADIKELKNEMFKIYQNYNSLNQEALLMNSNYVRENLSWKKLVNDFKENTLPKLNKKSKLLTLVMSNNNPVGLNITLESLRVYTPDKFEHKIYLVDNSEPNSRRTTLNIATKYLKNDDVYYPSNFDLGQRGSLLQMLDSVDINEYDYIQIINDGIEFLEPIDIFSNILLHNSDCYFVTGLMSKEHTEVGWRDTKFGRLCEKNSLRTSHIFMKTSFLKTLLPIHLDSQYGQSHNSSWNLGLDWELTWWNKNSPGKLGKEKFVLCSPGSISIKGENEYGLDELKLMRNG